ncbi:MAG TPA: phosphotransferase family protein [Pyrinomonadaceae bacterium]|nr:phosphotransferase family protein [Pyrinomonadaceae bacterium]
MTTSRDSTPVRSGEELDLVALDRYLREGLDTHHAITDSARIEVEQFPGGHSNLTYLVRFAEQEFVLRRPPVGPVAPTAHDMPREFKLLSIVHPRFPLAPKPILLCEDTSILGVPFYLMERRRGLIVRSKVPEVIGDDHEVRKKLSAAVVDTLVDLHAVDIFSSGIVNLGKPLGFVTRQVRGWAERWYRSQTGDVPEMPAVINWLESNLPTEREDAATIVHNDFKIDNLMLDEKDPTRVMAVLDWEMCTVGDPLVDVGLFLSYWTMQGRSKTDSLRAVTNGPGWFSREEIIERYAGATGRDLSGIIFYETFARFKVAVVIQQIYFRYVQGQTQDERFRNLDRMVVDLGREALELAEAARN